MFIEKILNISKESVKPKVPAGLFKHPTVVALVLSLAYLLIFQLRFILSGDVWAEGFSEFLDKSLQNGPSIIYTSSWEGYLTLLPTFLCKLYISLSGPVGMIDYFYRLIVVIYAVGSVVFVAAPINRLVIRSDTARIALALGCLFLLSHVSSFSFINVWYMGFLPIIIMSLNPIRLSLLKQLAYTVFAIVVCLTKPSVIVMPFVIYRAIKTREYISGILIFAATLMQTYLLFFATKNGARSVSFGISKIAHAIYIGGGVDFLKILRIYPTHSWMILLANIIILLLFGVLFIYRGWLIGLLILFGYLFSIYSDVLAPGATKEITTAAIYLNHFKLQRELLTGVFILILLFMSIEKLLNLARNLRYGPYLAMIIVLLVTGFTLRLPNRIDTTSSAVYADMSAFRRDLNDGRATCLPVEPTPTWSYGTNWFLQYHGGCSPINYDKHIDLSSFNEHLNKLTPITINGFDGHELKTLTLLIKDCRPDVSQLSIQDVASGVRYSANVKGGSPDCLRFVSYNLNGYPARDSYVFNMYSPDPKMTLGKFQDGQTPTYYAYYMGLTYP